MSVRSLAASSGVTSGFISQLENGHVMPSVSTLVRLAASLGTGVGELFDSSRPRTMIVRHDARPRFEYPDLGIVDEIVSADPNDKLEVLLGYIQPNGGSGDDLYTHGAESEFVLVLSGELQIMLGDEQHVLTAGDAITFSGDTPHGYVNRQEEPAHVLWAMTPVSY
jgi:transcriptional regulator with XRE-family HTH domain